MSEPISAYCVRCRAKRPIENPTASINERGGAYTRGACPVCGMKLTRWGRTPAHEGLTRPEPPAPERAGRLVIVESPAKARTIGRLLGKSYRVMASVGHVRDLLRSQLSVDLEHDFQPRYRVPNDKRRLVKELSEAVAGAAVVYLATDPDREGEAIAWHLQEATALEAERSQRVVFHEITPEAVAEAFAHPGEINTALVNAQQARRVLDRLVGYQISPLLWSRVRNRLTAGRVQSVAVRLIVEREREIEAFVPVEYWSLSAELAKQDRPEGASPSRFLARLHRIEGQPFELPDQAAVDPILDALETGVFLVSSVQTGQRRRSPQAPFTTSSLQQAASNRLGFRAQRTMQVAQQLYEGIELEGETVGLITYMRTDSVHVAAPAQAEANRWIRGTYGADYAPPEPPVYKTRARSAQEAHEAVRPTSVYRTPDSIRRFVGRDQFRLYQLIWQRFVASQMAPARYRTQTALIEAGPAGSDQRPFLFRATGSSLEFAGYLVVYHDEATPGEDEERQSLPDLAAGERLDLVRFLPEQHFSQPPPRYTEASLVKALEEHGIGRPSTYAPTLATVQGRGYVERVEPSSRALRPTEIGILVDDLLSEWFPEVISTDFTARLEDRLDEIAAGEADWVAVVRDFYTPFSARLAAAEAAMPEHKLADQPVGRDCPECGHPLVVKWGRYGQFIACQNYPACKHTEPWLEPVGVACPRCGGELVGRRTRKGRPFYGCANYPACEFTSWKRPLAAACPHCGGLLVAQNRRAARCLDCGESVPLERIEPGD